MPVVTKKENEYSVRIYWNKGPNVNNWDEVCEYAVEYFGLPGDKFRTDVCKDYMDFIFKNEQDAIWFSLRCE